jgi:hypothetical protein
MKSMRENVIARFQAVEYITRFHDWSAWMAANQQHDDHIRRFRIISQDRIIGIGGYLTSRANIRKTPSVRYGNWWYALDGCCGK